MKNLIKNRISNTHNFDNMPENKKRILDKFQEHLNADYKAFCVRHGINPSTNGMITYMIDKELIPISQIKRYTLQQEFEYLFPKKNHHKTKTVNMLADKFNISERAIWGILKRKK